MEGRTDAQGTRLMNIDSSAPPDGNGPVAVMADFAIVPALLNYVMQPSETRVCNSWEPSYAAIECLHSRAPRKLLNATLRPRTSGHRGAIQRATAEAESKNGGKSRVRGVEHPTINDPTTRLTNRVAADGGGPRLKQSWSSAACFDCAKPGEDSEGAQRHTAQCFATLDSRSAFEGLNICSRFRAEVLFRGPPDSPFEGGLYHGRIVLPKNYPFAPPSLMLLTRNGRFDINKKICLSASSHHPELWQPAWGIRTLLDALCAFFPTPAQGALHALEASEKDRRQMALESASWVCPVCKRPNRQLVEEGCAAPSNTLPELPEQLKAQALLARDTGKQQPEKADAAQGPMQVERASDSGTTSAASPSSSSSANNSGNGITNSSSSSDGLSVARDSGGVPTGRRSARPQSSPFWAYRLGSPQNRTEFLIAWADLMLLLLLLASLLLLGDLLLQPPRFSLLLPSPSLNS
ncbi:ubiquitin-conjugating enzyme e2, putative [Eimeria brunetti]|uniref:Ubiquitin-conjugating enzyme e2, putative n=1 Tax=Eimeria brunetti TaxID=51314 RepID=U6LE39_9EIME|nr:ubiquitin-conjugating enzyme e2, putative [Eimeria brunetti]